MIITRASNAVHELKLKIISGGQTGADRAALDWAIDYGVAHGGWCPLGRKAEDGVIALKYLLTEMESPDYRKRTVANVRESDATLIVNLGLLDGGTLETARIAKQQGKPIHVIQADGVDEEIAAVLAWLERVRPVILNVAGPRESKRPGIYGATWHTLTRIFPELVDSCVPDSTGIHDRT